MVRKKIRAFLCRISRKYKYWVICKATGMKKIRWQREFIFGDSGLPADLGRGSGKTVAVLMKLLMLDGLNAAEAKIVLQKDPDWKYDSYHRKCWYEQEHTKMVMQCREYGVPVPLFRLSRFEER